MNDITLDDITQEQYNEAAAVLIDMMRTAYPKLDLRNGTALRDLLVNPDATISAWFTQQALEQRECSSLKLLQERSEAGEAVDASDVSAILSNFGMAASAGSRAQGKVRVSVSESRKYVVAEGFQFSTYDGITFVTTAEHTVSETPDSDEDQLYAGTAGYYFIIPVIAVDPGFNGNLRSGDALNPASSFYGFVSASAYADFSGGADMESISSLIARIPSSLSQRGLLTKYAVEGQLRQNFDSGDHPIVAVSACGYGNPAQIRDRHNVLGIGVGGRVDVYVRNFTELPVSSSQVTFTRQSDGTYKASLSTGDFPGLYAVTGVNKASGGLGSYGFSVAYSADVSGTWHDISVDNSYIEAANTVWRNAVITLVDHDLTDDEESLQVTMICLPEIEALQDYVDAPSVRNVGSDYIVRCPMICQVHVNALVRHPYGVAFDKDTARQAVCDYINTSGFIKRLSRSEIACVLQENGASSVPLGSSGMLYGEVYDGAGNLTTFSGDSLDISSIATPSTLLTPDTCVFTCTPEDVEIEVMDE